MEQEIKDIMQRLLMNLLQMEYDVLPTKVFKEDKAEYIQALIDTREAEDTDIFINCMAKLHCEHLQQDIDQFLRSTAEEMVDKMAIQQELVGKWSIKPTLAGKLADIIEFMTDKEEIKTEHLVSELGLTETTAKRYLRQLTEFGYLEAHGGNRNKSYTIFRNLTRRMNVTSSHTSPRYSSRPSHHPSGYELCSRTSRNPSEASREWSCRHCTLR